MILDLNIKKKPLRRLVYWAGALIEVLGFALLFNSNGTIKFITDYKILFMIFLIASGYIIAVGGRRIK